jgi:inosine-uridine nucleoside N-ribohydrolase
VEPAELSDTRAPQAIVELAERHRGEIAFVFVGPLTNLAVALKLEPRIAQWVERLVIMGGAFFNPGNVTEHAEFNIFVDPEAAACVAAAGFNATWVGLDATHNANLTRADWDKLTDDSVAVTLVREVTRRSLVELGRPTFHLHDPLAVAVASEPESIYVVNGEVLIDTGEFRRGMTRCAETAPDRIAIVARDVRHEAFDPVFNRLIPR